MRSLQTKVIVIGSGPGGLMAALTAAGQYCSVTLLEALPSPGRKLLASGAGKCNFTNMLTAEAMAERFPPEQRRFVKPSLMNFTPDMCRKFLKDNGINYKLVDDFYCFPESEKATDILNMFLRKLQEYNVKVICDACVENITADGENITSVTVHGREYFCDYLIAAGGGPGYPRLGGRGSLDKICTEINIPMETRYPALCGIKSKDGWLNDLAGMVLENTAVTLDKNNFAEGTLLFTGTGISGPAALDLSGRVAKVLDSGKEVILKINFRKDYTRNTWQEILNKARQQNGKKLLHNALANLLPQGLLCNIIQDAGASEIIAARINKSTLERLLNNLSAMQCNVSAVENWEKAMASTGGVSRSAVNARTMQCRLYKNLYFAGEFIDVDGPCGGYNIQWALSSGYLAGCLKD